MGVVGGNWIDISGRLLKSRVTNANFMLIFRLAENKEPTLIFFLLCRCPDWVKDGNEHILWHVKKETRR